VLIWLSLSKFPRPKIVRCSWPAHPQVVELDCNPAMVLERGAVVVDARVRVAPPGPRLPWPALGAEPPTIRSPYGPERRERAEAGPSAES
jgi:hypothetical protein